jgi:Rrf2 family protein
LEDSALVRISHKVDYGVRAMVALARIDKGPAGEPVTREALAEGEGIPATFLDEILRTLRNHDLVQSHRGPDGGWTIGRAAREITVADVIRALEGPLASVRGIRPHDLGEAGVEEPLVSLWVAVRAALRSVLEEVTIADLAAGKLPKSVARLAASDDAWDSR